MRGYGGVSLASRQVRADIESAIAEGATLAEVEREIVDTAPVSDDARAALWLFAWGAAERLRRGARLQRGVPVQERERC